MCPLNEGVGDGDQGEKTMRTLEAGAPECSEHCGKDTSFRVGGVGGQGLVPRGARSGRASVFADVKLLLAPQLFLTRSSAWVILG